MIRVILPAHLRTLAGVPGDIDVSPSSATIGGVLDAIEAAHPMLKGTIRDHATLKRRPFVRFFAAGRDISFASAADPLPDAVANGDQPFMIVGAIAGG
jgi:molybdopterin synthase sulfur carrier subunit